MKSQMAMAQSMKGVSRVCLSILFIIFVYHIIVINIIVIIIMVVIINYHCY